MADNSRANSCVLNWGSLRQTKTLEERAGFEEVSLSAPAGNFVCTFGIQVIFWSMVAWTLEICSQSACRANPRIWTTDFVLDKRCCFWCNGCGVMANLTVVCLQFNWDLHASRVIACILFDYCGSKCWTFGTLQVTKVVIFSCMLRFFELSLISWVDPCEYLKDLSGGDVQKREEHKGVNWEVNILLLYGLALFYVIRVLISYFLTCLRWIDFAAFSWLRMCFAGSFATCTLDQQLNIYCIYYYVWVFFFATLYISTGVSGGR